MSDEGARDGRKPRPARRPPRTQGSHGEFDFIERIRHREFTRLGLTRHTSPLNAQSSLRRGIGDDAAVISQRSGLDTIITADLLVEGIDFDLDRLGARPRDIGHKALAVSLSDIAAMGARPRYCLLSVGVPATRWRTSFLREFYDGVQALASRHDVAIIGGDTSRTPDHVVIDSIVLGEVERGRAVMRSGARPGDLIYVTGSLGGAAAGLRILQKRADEREATKSSSDADETKRVRAEKGLVSRQSRPTPRVEWGAMLGERRLATALIDLSDGLSSDLAHLCRESEAGATIEAARIPLDPLLKTAGIVGADALSFALDGGEDFELLFTVSPRNAAKLPAKVGGVAATLVGEISADAGEVLLAIEGRKRRLKPRGYEHFKSEGE